MYGSDFEMQAHERMATRNAEADAFAAERGRVRLAGGNFWTHLFGTMPRPRRKTGERVATPVTTRPLRHSR
jgi:hypothetical protein